MEMTNFNNSELVELNSNELEGTNGGAWPAIVVLAAVVIGGAFVAGVIVGAIEEATK